MARLPRGGFETELALAGLNVSYLRAEALDRQSRVLASTAVVDAKSGKVVSADAAVVNVIQDEEDDVEDGEGEEEDPWTSLDYAADQDWQTAMVIFVVFGMGLSACCLSYALVLNRCFRCGSREQAYTSL